MKVSSSENTYSNSAYSNNGMSGMVSGMDTEGLVKSMLSNVQTKIDKQTQSQTILEWKQESYRDIIQKVNDFRDKYFTASGENSILLSSTFKTATTQSSSSAIKVTPTVNAVEGNFEMMVTQLATSAKITSTGTASSGMDVKSDVTAPITSSTGKKLTVVSGGETIEIDISGALSESDIVSKINDGVAKYNKLNGTSVNVSASLGEDKKITYSGSGENKDFEITYFKSDGTEESKITNLDSGVNKTGVLTTGKYDKSNTISVKIGDETINVDLSGKNTNSDISDTINTALSGKGVSTSIVDNKLVFTADDTSKSFSVSGSKCGLATIGMDKPASSTSGVIAASSTTSIQQNKIMVNGQEIVLGNDDTIDVIAEKIRTQAPSISVSVSDGGLKLSGSDANSQITITGEAADMAKFGLQANAESTVTNRLTADGPTITSKGALAVSYNGVSKNITITDSDTLDSFRDKLYSAFGSGIEVSQISEDGKDKVFLNTGTGKTLSLSGSEEALKYLGIEKESISNHIDTNKSIASLYGSGTPGFTDDDIISFNINNTQFSFKGSTSLSDMMSEVNSSRAGVTMTYNSLNDKFSIKSNETGSGSQINAVDGSNGVLEKIFGTSSLTASGTDAELKIDGEDVKYSGNDITYNGINLTLKETTTTPVTIETSKDTDKALNAIKSFVGDYNKLIEELNKQIHEDATYKKYPPLTSEQKDEMSESEIKKWEEKSKTGLLKGDSDISSFLQEMRKVLYSNTGDTKMLSDIGIESSKEWNEYGKLNINTEKLTEVLNNDMQGVAQIFTGSNGLASRLSDVCKKATNASSANPGSLVSMAGMKSKATDKNNTITNKINAIKDKITKLKEQYETRKTRYWKQFNTMESALGNMNSASSWLTSMLGG